METETLAHSRRRITSARVKVGSPAERIVDRFGGLANFCEACDFGRSAVHGWMRNGLIPAKWREEGVSYQRWIIERGDERGIHISAVDFIEDAAAI